LSDGEIVGGRRLRRGGNVTILRESYAYAYIMIIYRSKKEMG